jgi:hypothetical protein
MFPISTGIEGNLLYERSRVLMPPAEVKTRHQETERGDEREEGIVLTQLIETARIGLNLVPADQESSKIF